MGTIYVVQSVNDGSIMMLGDASLLPCCLLHNHQPPGSSPHGNSAVLLLQASLLHNVGFKAADFRRLMQTRPQVFASTASTIKGKLVFLQQELGFPTSTWSRC